MRLKIIFGKRVERNWLVSHVYTPSEQTRGKVRKQLNTRVVSGGCAQVRLTAPPVGLRMVGWVGWAQNGRITICNCGYKQPTLVASTVTPLDPKPHKLIMVIPHKGAIHPWARRGVGLPTDAQG